MALLFVVAHIFNVMEFVVVPMFSLLIIKYHIHLYSQSQKLCFLNQYMLKKEQNSPYLKIFKSLEHLQELSIFNRIM